MFTFFEPLVQDFQSIFPVADQTPRYLACLRRCDILELNIFPLRVQYLLVCEWMVLIIQGLHPRDFLKILLFVLAREPQLILTVIHTVGLLAVLGLLRLLFECIQPLDTVRLPIID